MRVLILLLFMVTSCCYAQQDDYQARLSLSLQEMSELKDFSNDIVYHDNIGNCGSWEPDINYSEGDWVQFRTSGYEAIANSKGKSPDDSPNEWAQIWGPHPYLFFKYHAKIDDLRKLVKSDQPFIRTYAFAALLYRKEPGIFKIVLDNLSDTTRISQFFSDYGYSACPADIMLFHSVEGFTNMQKDSLKELILYKYNHLNTLDDVMLFHKPTIKDYQQIKGIVMSKRKDAFGLADAFDLLALARYRKQEDVEFILTGFNNIQYYSGVKLFFKAIEEFPDPAFKSRLIEYGVHFRGRNDSYNYFPNGEEYFYNALAAYHDQECFDLLSKITDQFLRSENRKDLFMDSKTENLTQIHYALTKYFNPMYAGLLRKIGKQIPKKANREVTGHTLETNPWNY